MLENGSYSSLSDGLGSYVGGLWRTIDQIPSKVNSDKKLVHAYMRLVSVKEIFKVNITKFVSKLLHYEMPTS